jgi:hypothetical protein
MQVRRLSSVGTWACVSVLIGGCGSDGSNNPGVSSGATRGSAGDTGGSTGDATGETDATDTVDTYESADGTGATMGTLHGVDCDEPPPAAVGAIYQHRPVASGFPGAVSWQMQGLPSGMTFNPVNGEIGGTPQEEGTFDVEITATGSGLEATQTCTLDVGASVSVDLSGLTTPCIGPDDDVLEFVTGGDGAPVTCNTPSGSGNGTLPEGVSVDPETCAIEGAPDDAYGTWVWMTELRQSGARAWVPYCVTVHEQAPDAYGIAADHSGGTDNVLEPAIGHFTAGEPIAWGGEGDPLFRVTGPCGPSSCYYGYAFTVSSSPFGGCGEDACYGLAPTALVHEDDAPIGFTHEMFALGPAVPAAFESRPFVLGWNVDYCIADTGQTCSGVQNIKDNGNGRLRFSVLMLPAAP